MTDLVTRARQRHPTVRVEHPPEMWPPAADDAVVDALIDALLAVGSPRHDTKEGLLLLVNNVTVVPDEEGAWAPPGDYVGLTMEGDTIQLGDSTWRSPYDTVFVNEAIDARARRAGTVYGYTRGEPRRSITCFLPRR
jgi:hypothetical protein